MNISADMTDGKPDSSSTQPSTTNQPIVIIGAGPVGTRAAQELCKNGKHVVLINAERWKPYNRVKLTPLLAGETQLGKVYLSEYFTGHGKVERFDGVTVTDVDRDEKQVLLSTGRIIEYDKLVFATGSRPFIPNIPGADLSGIFAFRNFDDAEQLIARSMSARKVLVIGGGLLGLEAARGMAQRGAHVTVIEHETRLMPRQLDDAAADILKNNIEDLGINVITGTRVMSMNGKVGRVESVTLSDERTLPFDTVIICTGVRANIQLPSAIGLDFNRGIMVDDKMRSSDPDIYAIGECAQHNDVVVGLVGPGYEQAMTAISSICGDYKVSYEGSTPTTKLKVLGADVFSIGDFESASQHAGSKSHIFIDKEQGIYRRLFVERGKIVAALGVGEWPEATMLQQAVNRGQSVRFWNLLAFKKSGQLWNDNDDSVANWPRDAIICNCTGVNKGAISDAIILGAENIDDIRMSTSANTVCGTCRPLVLELLGEGDKKPEPAKWWRFLITFSLVAAFSALASLLLPRIALPENFTIGDIFTKLWFDSIWKQYSGYTLLGITVAAAIIGLRKRIKIFAKLGSYDGWRLVHLVIGIAAALVLVWHTGFRLGSNLNLFLMLSFLATLIFGAVAGFITGSEHELQERGLSSAKSSPRKLPLWVHIIALWPLPVLLIIHILSVYTY